MKKLFLSLTLLHALLFAKSQCTNFLGPNQFLMPCSNPFILNPAIIFNQPPSTQFELQQWGAFDTIPGQNGAPDVIRPLTSKTYFRAVRSDGCVDECVVSVEIRDFPLPNLGPDVNLHLAIQQETMDISSQNNGISFISGYDHHNWTVPINSLNNVDTGIYTVTVVTHDGCSDSKDVMVKCAIKRDTSVFKCRPDKYNLTALYVKPGHTNSWKTIRSTQGDTIPTPTPSAVDTGRYMLLTSKQGRCTDTIFVMVENLPRLNLGPDRKVVKCTGSTINVTLEFFLAGLTTQWNIPDATKANTGIHRLIATNSDGCKDTAFIEVRDTTKPNIGPDQFETICPIDNPINLSSNFNLTDLYGEWNIPNPDGVQAAGTYQLIAQNAFGCRDTAYFSVFHFDKPYFLRDTTIKLCFGKTKDLNTIYSIPNGYSLVDWSTLTPATAGAGIYIITVADNFQGCNFTAVVTITVQPNNTEILNLCKYNAINSGFTTNVFRTVTVDKAGRVWAGTSGGGLYRFNQLNNSCLNGNTWEKFKPTSGISTDSNTYRDLQSSNILGDTSLWAASIGHTLPYNYTGGVDHILGFNNPVVHFGSVNGGPVNGGLSSRNCNSIALGKSKKLYAALGFSQQPNGITMLDSTLDGGTFVYDLVTNPPSFTALPLNMSVIDNRFSAAGTRKNEIWFGYDNIANGVTANRILKWNDATGTYAGFVDANNSPIPFGPGLEVRAIFTDSSGRTFVGLNSGNGIAMLDSNTTDTTPEWFLANAANSPLPAGATVNFNSITQVIDEIWIGTTAGLMVYNGYGSFTECASWKLYTTANNLPSNNVTDIAIDTTNFNIWLTTDEGICRLVFEKRIIGTVVNVNAGRYDALLPTLNKTPLKNVEIKLIQASGSHTGVVVQSIMTTATGNFEFTDLNPLITYKMEVRYTGKNYQYYYQYKNLKYNSAMGLVLIPDSLNTELDTLKFRLEKHKFEFELYTHKFDNIFVIDDFLRTAEGYTLDNYKLPFEYINNNLQITDIEKRIDNIANYYLDLSVIYNMGIKSSDYKLKQLESFVDAIEALKGMAEAFETALKIVSPGKYIYDLFAPKAETKFSFIEEIKKKVLDALTDDLKNAITEKLEKVKFDDPAVTADFQKTLKEFKVFLGKAIDVFAVIDGGVDGLKDNVMEALKKGFLMYLTRLDYTDYCRELHKDLIPKLAQYSTQLISSNTYAQNYDLVQSLTISVPQRSLNKQLIDSCSIIDANIASLKESSETVETILSCSNAVAELSPIVFGIIGGAVSGGAGIIPGVGIGLKVARVIRGLEIIAHGFKVYDLFKSTFVAHDGRAIARKISRYVAPTSGFSSLPLQPEQQQPEQEQQVFTFTSLDSLVSKKNKYNQKVTELNAITSVVYDSATYYSKFKEFANADSAFRIELNIAGNAIWPKAANAIKLISEFENKLTNTFENLVNQQTRNRISVNMLQMAYQLNPYDDTVKQRFDTIRTQVINFNNSSVAALQELVDLINANNIQAPAYLVQTNYQLQFKNQPDSNGTVTYTLKNIGNVAQINVTAQITQPTGGFNITSTPFINAGTIAPGESKQIVYNFKAPHSDTTGNYDIIIHADNGSYNNIAGAFITATLVPAEVTTIANGLWSNPETWSSHRVPDAGSEVTVKHQVDVDITTAECKSIKAIAPGLLKVKAGMKLSVMK
ncbi:MAG: hypothetical protein V4722_12160 [Bacteroidota bacterium]